MTLHPALLKLHGSTTPPFVMNNKITSTKMRQRMHSSPWHGTLRRCCCVITGEVSLWFAEDRGTSIHFVSCRRPQCERMCVSGHVYQLRLDTCVCACDLCVSLWVHTRESVLFIYTILAHRPPTPHLLPSARVTSLSESESTNFCFSAARRSGRYRLITVQEVTNKPASKDFVS